MQPGGWKIAAGGRESTCRRAEAQAKAAGKVVRLIPPGASFMTRGRGSLVEPSKAQREELQWRPRGLSG